MQHNNMFGALKLLHYSPRIALFIYLFVLIHFVIMWKVSVWLGREKVHGWDFVNH